MNSRTAITALFASALLLGTALVPAAALDLNLGGSGDSTGVNATTGGDNSVASATVSPGNGTGDANVNIGQKKGSLVDLNQGDDGSTNGDVNLGALGLDNVDLTDLTVDPNVGNVPILKPAPTQGTQKPVINGGGGKVSLSSNDRALLRTRCPLVIANPASYDGNLIKLCLIVQKMGG